LTNGQAVMHYIRHHLMALLIYMTVHTYTPTNDQFARPLVSLLKTKSCQFNLVKSNSVQLHHSMCAVTQKNKKARKNQNWSERYPGQEQTVMLVFSSKCEKSIKVASH